ncbi:MAG: hypothetical protein LBO72_10665 [Helicobacteraceae bacterium]|jgi:hypothetical protein|nr:hypothetical protein [Helicobacteraceae bacterium]
MEDKDIDIDELTFWCWAINAVLLSLWAFAAWGDSPGLMMDVLFGAVASFFFLFVFAPIVWIEMFTLEYVIKAFRKRRAKRENAETIETPA